MKNDNKYSKCNHIWINTLQTNDNQESITKNYLGCIKCGLDKKILYITKKYNDTFLLSQIQQEMYEYLNNNPNERGLKSNVICDLSLGKAIYSKILENNPKIDDITALKYFEIALDNIRNIETTQERKNSRIKRLSLSPNFDKWMEDDVKKFKNN